MKSELDSEDYTSSEEDSYYTSSDDDDYSTDSEEDYYSDNGTDKATYGGFSTGEHKHQLRLPSDGGIRYINSPRPSKKTVSFKPVEVQPFRHTRLKRPEKELRLIKVESWKGTGPIRCSMKAFNRKVASKRTFRALSYHWGSPSPSFTIHINDRSFSIGKNLYEFLEHAAKMKAARVSGWATGTYWIDALCIDQQHEVEKATQLAYMRHVYRRASETIIWLGPGGAGVAQAMQYIKSQSHAVKKALSQDNMSVLLTGSRDDLLDDRNLVKAIGVLLSSPYWDRVWILQEIAVSDKVRQTTGSTRERVRMVCGEGEVAWSKFLQYAICIPLLDFRHDEEYKVAAVQRRLKKKQAVWLISYLHGAHNNTVPGLEVIDKAQVTLGLLIYLSERSQSSRSQDYIYSLLGLVKHGPGKDLTPSSNRSGCQVICQAIRRLMDQGRIFDGEQSHYGRAEYYQARLRKLAAKAKHQPLVIGSKIDAKRKRCSGPYYHGCEDSCDALDVCRQMAGALYAGRTLLIVRFAGQSLEIGRDKTDRRPLSKNQLYKNQL
ncbi:uncharacterized protein N0V89_004855 [Didymosphaeria variabile]|uniref:Heterokaryon incompatibility domain-containing protein n=1 Tax=Didymosphaeria variabile TaxID=1932322 RepID=A0A9W8XQ69_9PLEO|nr:uncharacterized protein N0V89_004855 [Didymosphaeria variabile]KAJ4356818.1 hypothetical protein N0V89_004855 [Didymosphaeria variabile]